MTERVEITPVPIVPPMKLQEVEAIHAHPRERDADRFLDDRSRHPARLRHPFCEGLDFGKPAGSVTGSELLPEIPNEIFGGTVVIGEIPSREPGIMIGE